MRSRRIGVGGATARVLTLAAILFAWSGCGNPDIQEPTAAEIVLLNWEEYTDLAVLADFERETGIRVR